MSKYKINDMLQKLDLEFPRPLNICDFSIPLEDKQKFLNFLLEMNQRGLIDAKFITSRMRNSYELPLDVANIVITKEGRAFMEAKETPHTVTQNITINGSPGSLNIAGRDIKISNGADAEKFIKDLLDNIDKSNLQPKEKSNLTSSLKNVFSATTPGVVATQCR